MSARADLAAALKPHIPAKWRIIDTERNVDVLDRFTVVIRQQSIAPAANMLGSTLTTFVLTLISPRAIADDYEDDLDTAANVLFMVLVRHMPNLEFSKASKRIWNSSNPAYDFDITAVTELSN